MSRVIVICPEQELLSEVDRLLTECKGVRVERKLAEYPDRGQLTRILRTADPDVIFLSGHDPDAMEAATRCIVEASPGAPVILIDRNGSKDTLVRAMRIGIRECVPYPLRLEDLQGTLTRSMEWRAANSSKSPVTKLVYSFLPAKPGVGATTLAVQSALAAARMGEGRSFLLDADLSSGMVRFLLKLGNSHSFRDAMDHAEELDETVWPQLISQHKSLDCLHAGDIDPHYVIDLQRLEAVLEFTRRLYESVMIDLPGRLERYEMELMTSSKRVLLVTTPEIASLHMAKAKYNYLKDSNLGDQVTLIINRHEKSCLTKDEIAKLVGIPAQFTMGNDYAGVQKSLVHGGAVETGSLLGRQITQLAGWMLGKEPAAQKAASKGFLRRLSFLPAGQSSPGESGVNRQVTSTSRS